MKLYKTHGDGSYHREDFRFIGENVIIESGVKIFHPENIILHDNVYIGHNSILKGYYKNVMEIGTNSWIGQNCFFHSAGGIKIGVSVGVGPFVKILTSSHDISKISGPIISNKLVFGKVSIEDGVDVGVGTTILSNVKICKYSQVGAMSLVNKSIPSKTVYGGIPAKFIRKV